MVILVQRLKQELTEISLQNIRHAAENRAHALHREHAIAVDQLKNIVAHFNLYPQILFGTHHDLADLLTDKGLKIDFPETGVNQVDVAETSHLFRAKPPGEGIFDVYGRYFLGKGVINIGVHLAVRSVGGHLESLIQIATDEDQGLAVIHRLEHAFAALGLHNEIKHLLFAHVGYVHHVLL